MKLKILPPSLREKKRYILFKILSEEKIELHQFKELFFSTILSVFGEFGFSLINAKFLDNIFDRERQVGILKVHYKKVPEAIFSLGLISRIGDSRVNVKIYKVSGTIKNLKQNNLKIKKN
ncbi:MAG: Rpp14/Pop5 family protein [Candidatus Aenigmatarchaeota archaeon]